MGVRTLSACLRERGFETVVVLMANLEADYTGFRWDDLFALCKDSGLIGISCMTHAVNKAVEVRKRLAEVTAAPILAGGIHATLDPESLLKSFQYVCHGEGEDMIVEMARRLENGEALNDIPGLWSNTGGVIIRNPAAALERDVNEYPFPDYDMTHQYVIDGGGLTPVRPIPFHMSIEDFVVLGSRGCPHHCTYCCNRKIKADFPWRKKVVHYSVDYLIDLLREVKRCFPEVKSFWIEDDTFFAKSLEEIKLFAGRYKEEIALPFKILISPWTYSKEKLDPLVDAGMEKLMMGIQSGCERVNKELYDRNMTNQRLLDIARSLHEYPQLLKCYDFIGMNPFETTNDLVETTRFIRELPVPFYMFSNNLAFYPGTELSDQAIRAGIDISRRVKHSEAEVGYGILLHDKLDHKLFHLLLLLMSGMVTRRMCGRVPRFMISEPMIRFYASIDLICPKLGNAIAVSLTAVCHYCNWKKLVKKIFSPRTIGTVRHFLARLRGQERSQ
jgi:radical SAM superfamily enzyme YgiQ (UPF0313 family)